MKRAIAILLLIPALVLGQVCPAPTPENSCLSITYKAEKKVLEYKSNVTGYLHFDTDGDHQPDLFLSTYITGTWVDGQLKTAKIPARWFSNNGYTPNESWNAVVYVVDTGDYSCIVPLSVD